MLTEQLERETKYAATAELQLPDLSALVPDGGRLDVATHHLSSEYFDSAEHDLLERGITLRRRTGSTDTGWHLKVPAGAAATRTEIRSELTAERDVPAELATLVVGVCRGASLQSIVTITTERTAHRILDAEGRLVAEIADDRVSAVAQEGSEARVTTWREIEAELGPAGTDDVLSAVDALLMGAGATVSPAANKVATALGAVASTADSPGAKKPRTAGEALRRYLAEQDAALLEGDIALRRGQSAIHNTRVATRRMRSTLRIFSRYFEAERVHAFDADLVWFAVLLGAVRDREVQRARIGSAVAQLPAELVIGPVAGDIDAALESEEARHRAELLEAMTGPRYLALLQESALWARTPPLTPRAEGKPGKLAKDLAAAEKRVARHLAAGIRSEDDEELHTARKSGKRARYAAEVVASVAGADSVRSVNRHRKLQDLLGEHQDAIGAGAILLRLAEALPAGTSAFTYGILHAREAENASTSRVHARAWAKKHAK